MLAFFTNEMEAASSGRLVPIASMLNPINSSGTPAMIARFLALNTRQSDPAQSAPVESRMKKAESKELSEEPPDFSCQFCLLFFFSFAKGFGSRAKEIDRNESKQKSPGENIKVLGRV